MSSKFISLLSVTLGVGASVTVAHGIVVNDVSVAPHRVDCDRDSGIVCTGVTATTATFNNPTGTIQMAIFCARWMHSILAKPSDFPVPFLYSGGGGSTGATDISLYGSGELGAQLAQPTDAAYNGGDYTTFVLPVGNTLSPAAPDSVVIIRATQSITIEGTIDVSSTTSFLALGEFAQGIHYAGLLPTNPGLLGCVSASGSGGGGGGGDSGGNVGTDGMAGASTRPAYAVMAGYGVGATITGAVGAAGTHGAPAGAGGAGGLAVAGQVFPGVLREMGMIGVILGIGGGTFGCDGNVGGSGGAGANAGSGGAVGGNGGNGGSGGPGGGLILLIAPSITIAATGQLLANGAVGTAGVAGANGAAGAINDGGGGGGGGGSGGQGGAGGVVSLVYQALANAGTISVLGGAGGAGGASGAGGAGAGLGAAGASGGAGADGAAGSTGVFILSQQST